jgi:hypothetical protein
MDKRWAIVAVGALALAGCAHKGGGDAGTPGGTGERIDYETGPCFGFCPVYKVSVYPGGRGVFTGIRNTNVSGEQAFTVTPEQYAAFARALAPFRPAIGDRLVQPGKPGCEHQATDLPSVDIHWTGMGRQLRRLYFYYGCNMEANAKMAEALGNAPDALPIATMIGETP